MALSCETCGGFGNQVCLVTCLRCHSSAVHRYCLPEVKRGDEQVTWDCEECVLKRASLSERQIIVPKDTESLEMEHPVDISGGVQQNNAENGTCRQNMSSTYCETIKENKKLDLTDKFEKNKRRRKLILQEDGMEQLLEPPQAHVIIDTDESKLGKKSAELKQVVFDGTTIHEADGAIAKVKRKTRRRKLILEEELDEFAETEDCPMTEASLRKDFAKPFSSIGAALTNISPKQASVEVSTGTHARPLPHPVWSGCLKVRDYDYGEVRAHLSDIACDRALQEAEMMPVTLPVKAHSRLDIWPKSFQKSPPNDESIALYFFPNFENDEEKFTSLMDEMISGDLALKISLDTSELLLFSSLLLPEHCKIPNPRSSAFVFLSGSLVGRACKASYSLRVELGNYLFVHFYNLALDLVITMEGGSLQKRFLWGVFKRKSDASSFETGGGTNARSASPKTDSGACQQGKEMVTQSDRCRNGDSGKSVTLVPLKKSDGSDIQELESHQKAETLYMNEIATDSGSAVFVTDARASPCITENISFSIINNDRTPSSVSTSSTAEDAVAASCSPSILDDVQDGVYTCLNLFPVTGEDLAIMVKIGNVSGINLDLGLGRRAERVGQT